MNIYDRVRNDFLRISQLNKSDSSKITLQSPTGETAEINGIVNNINLGVDTDGSVINSSKIHVTFSLLEESLTSYPTKNNKGEYNLKRHKVTILDATNTSKTYLIREWIPDLTVGSITCMLMNYE